jgi:opacity protein-like surface antigen
MKKLLFGFIISMFLFSVAYAQDFVIVYDAEVKVTIKDTQDAVTFAWQQDVSPGLAGWRLYQSKQSGVYASPPFAVIQFVEEKAEYTSQQTISANYGEDVTYYFVMTAVNVDGLESGYSNEVKYTANFVYPTPSSPKSLRIGR